MESAAPPQLLFDAYVHTGGYIEVDKCAQVATGKMSTTSSVFHSTHPSSPDFNCLIALISAKVKLENTTYLSSEKPSHAIP